MYVSPTFSCLGVAVALKAINVRNDIERQGMGKDLWMRCETEKLKAFGEKHMSYADVTDVNCTCRHVMKFCHVPGYHGCSTAPGPR